MAAIDWSKHTPHEIRMALDNPPKVAGPWRSLGAGCHYRHAWGDIVGYVSDRIMRWQVFEVWCNDYFDTGGCATLEDGKAKADAALRAAGWQLDDEDGPSPVEA